MLATHNQIRKVLGTAGLKLSVKDAVYKRAYGQFRGVYTAQWLGDQIYVGVNGAHSSQEIVVVLERVAKALEAAGLLHRDEDSRSARDPDVVHRWLPGRLNHNPQQGGSDMTQIKFEARFVGKDDEYLIETVVVSPQVDRLVAHAISLPPTRNSQDLAMRYINAVKAGVIPGNAEVRTDVNGKTYVSGVWKVIGRTLNADLRRLGF